MPVVHACKHPHTQIHSRPHDFNLTFGGGSRHTYTPQIPECPRADRFFDLDLFCVGGGQATYGHSGFEMMRARTKIIYNSLKFQYFFALMIIFGFFQDVVEAQTLPKKGLFYLARALSLTPLLSLSLLLARARSLLARSLALSLSLTLVLALDLACFAL